MVRAYHVVFSCYGFWLPNDPRGSWSDFVAAWELYRVGGKATKVETRQSLANVPHNRRQAQDVKGQMKLPPVTLDGLQARSVANGFAAACVKSAITLHACAILPDHVHLVVARHRYKIEQTVNLLKGEATKRLRADGLDPNPERVGHSPWSAGFWKVYLNSPESIWKAIKYVEANPVKDGKRPQHWSFVRAYEGD
ncbi:MAG: transposase [Planctomycetota bacterium]